MAVIYYSTEANKVNLQIFKNGEEEFISWLKWATENEPITICAIFDCGETTYYEMHKGYEKFIKKFQTGQVID